MSIEKRLGDLEETLGSHTCPTCGTNLDAPPPLAMYLNDEDAPHQCPRCHLPKRIHVLTDPPPPENS